MKNIIVTLTRLPDQSVQTLGEWVAALNDKVLFTCDTLERAWKNNQRGESCYPVGEYECAWHLMPTFQKFHYEITNIEGRVACFIHAGNFVTDVHGCTLLGRGYSYINKDKLLDVNNSRKVLEEFEKLLNGDPFKLIVVNKTLVEPLT